MDTQSSPPHLHRPRTWLAGASAVLLAGVLLAYGPVRGHDFVVYDDTQYVTENPVVRAGLTWEGVKWAFTTGHAGNWHPLTWLSHMLDVQLFGVQPAAAHLVSVGLHAANTVLVLLLLVRLTGARWRSAFVAAVFALHPLHVESVAWIAERKDLLCGFFFLLSLHAYVRAQEARRGEAGGPGVEVRSPEFSVRLSVLGSLLFFVCALLSKPMAVTLPFVLLLLDYWPLQRMRDGSAREILALVREKIPHFCLSIGSSVATFLAQDRGGAVLSLEKIELGDRVANAFVSYGRYLGKVFWPVDLAVFYPHPGRWPASMVLGGLVVVVALVGLAFVAGRRHRYLATGSLWFLGMLVPTIGLVQVGGQSIADRYMYLPLIGVALVIAWGSAELGGRLRIPRAMLLAVAAAVLVLCGVRTTAQVAAWRDTESLFRHAAAVTADNALAYDKLGCLLLGRGEIDAALELHRRAVRLQPGAPEFQNNLGNALWRKGLRDEALEAYRKALAAAPDSAVVLENAGVMLFERGELDAALAHFRRAVALRPDLVQSHAHIGGILLERHQPAEALAHIEAAVRLNPKFAPARVNRGAALLQRGRVREAIEELEFALELKPDSADARFHLAKSLLQVERAADAVAELQRVVAARPGFAEAHYLLGSIALNDGRVDEAIARLAKTVELQPDSVHAHNDLGVALIQGGRPADAARHFRRAVEISPDFASARNNLGQILQHEGGYAEAVAQYRAALKLEPENLDTLANLAWVLATAPVDGVRSGAHAIVLAQRASQQTEHRQPLILRTLAAAYAEAGRFPEAIGVAGRALNLAQERGEADLAAALRAELEGFANGVPLRDRPAAQRSP